MVMEWILEPQAWVSLLTLTALEIVLGIDNIVFISILANKLPEDQRDSARRVGIIAAMGMRILLLLGISWVVTLTEPLFELLGHEFSGRDLILIGGGLFLLAKATWEIHGRMEGDDHVRETGKVTSFWSVIAQIMVLDIIFSLDSVITAVGMVNEVAVMIAAVVIAVLVMLVASGYGTGCQLLQVGRSESGELTASRVWRSLSLKAVDSGCSTRAPGTSGSSKRWSEKEKPVEATSILTVTA